MQLKTSVRKEFWVRIVENLSMEKACGTAKEGYEL